MPLQIIRQDITLMNVDAIVNPSNEELLPGGGVDAAIHKRAGAQLLLACDALGGCKVAEAKITPGFNLPCKYVIHTVGPLWTGGNNNEARQLIDCYHACLSLAVKNGLASVAFPLISSGTYGFPKDQVLKIAIGAISEFLLDNELLVYIVVFDKSSYRLSEKLFTDVKAYVDDNYADEHLEAFDDMVFPIEMPTFDNRSMCMQEVSPAEYEDAIPLCKSAALPIKHDELKDLIKHLDDTFAVRLLKLIDAKGMTEVECYKKSNVSKKTFSKINNEKDYRPSKNTVLCFAIGLQLTLDETAELLKTVGYSLSKSSKFDVIVEYFISHANYNIFELNEVLFEYDLPLLGSVVA